MTFSVSRDVAGAGAGAGAGAADTPAWPAKLSHSIHFSQVCARILLQRTWSSGSGKMAGSTLRLRKLEIGQTSALESASPRWPKQI